MKSHSLGRTPKQDGFRMPGEFEAQSKIWMLWPERPDNWRDNARPAQLAFAEVAKAIARFEPVIVGASPAQLDQARILLPSEVQVVELESNDAWMRDVGPSFLVDGKGGLRAVDWTFNAWGGTYDGLYSDWGKDDRVAELVCQMEGVDRYRTEGFVLEGGSFHVDGEGTILTTEMCLLSPGRNPDRSKAEIEEMLCQYLNGSKVIWIKDGIDPEETNGHIDDVACFVRPGEAVCIWTDDPGHPFYQAAHAAYDTLCGAIDAEGRTLKVHKVCLPQEIIRLSGSETIQPLPGSVLRRDGDICIASYINFLIVNGGVIVPQYDDPNDTLALTQIQTLFPERQVVGVPTREIVFGGGNIHCITQQVPSAL